MVALVQQWIIPTVESSMEPFQDMQYSKIVERLLMLAVSYYSIFMHRLENNEPTDHRFQILRA